jgi:hypothetical protein
MTVPEGRPEVTGSSQTGTNDPNELSYSADHFSGKTATAGDRSERE